MSRIADEMHPAALPGCSRQHPSPDRVDETGVRVGDHQPPLRPQPSRDEAAEECHPARARSSVVTRSRPRISRSPSPSTPVATTSANVHDPASLSHLLGAACPQDVGVGTGVQGPVAKLGDLVVEGLRKLGDLGLGDPVDAHLAHDVVDSARRDALHVALGDDRDESTFGSASRL